jgi:hypothetical protein
MNKFVLPEANNRCEYIKIPELYIECIIRVSNQLYEKKFPFIEILYVEVSKNHRRKGYFTEFLNSILR